MWYSVVVIQKDVFESKIIDERHFSSVEDVKEFADKYKNNKDVAILIMNM